MNLLEAAGRAVATVGLYAGAALYAALLPARAAAQTWRRTARRFGEAYRSRLQEQFNPELYSGAGIDTDEWQYRRLSSSRRDLPGLTHTRQLELSNWLWRSNPLARRILEMVRDFVLGDGLTVEADAPEVQEVVDRFWQASVPDGMDRFQDHLLLEAGKAGEVFLPVFVNETDGSVQLGWLDPADVAAVLTEPKNVLVQTAVKVKSSTTAGGYDYLKIVREERDLSRHGYGLLMHAQAGDTIVDPAAGTQAHEFAGSCFVFQLNKPPAATRGAGDLLPLIDWLDAFDQAQWNSLDRIGFLNAFVWDVLVNGASEAELKQMQVNEPPPKPGSVRFHNEKVTWTAIQPDLKLGDFSTGVRMYLNHVLGGAGLPSHYFGASDDVNRASAAEMAEPTLRMLTKRQRWAVGVLGMLVRFAVDQAVHHGQVPEIVAISDKDGNPTGDQLPAREAFRILAPEISSKDDTSWATAFFQTNQALQLATDGGLLGTKTAREVLAGLLAQRGLQIDLEREAAEVEQEKQARAAEQQARFGQQQAALAARLAAAPADQNGAARANGRSPAGAAMPATESLLLPAWTVAGLPAALSESRVTDQALRAALEGVSDRLLSVERELRALPPVAPSLPAPEPPRAVRKRLDWGDDGRLLGLIEEPLPASALDGQKEAG